MRAFARAKAEVDSYEDSYDPKADPDRENAPRGKAVELVEEIRYGRIQEALDGSPDR